MTGVSIILSCLYIRTNSVADPDPGDRMNTNSTGYGYEKNIKKIMQRPEYVTLKTFIKSYLIKKLLEA